MTDRYTPRMLVRPHIGKNMARFTVTSSNNVTSKAAISTSTCGTLQYCTLGAGSYSFTVPTYKSAGCKIGWPGMFVSVIGGGGGGASGSSCGCSNGFSNGNNGSDGNLSCFGSVVAGGGCKGCAHFASNFCAGVADWGYWRIAICYTGSGPLIRPYYSGPSYCSTLCNASGTYVCCCGVGGGCNYGAVSGADACCICCTCNGNGAYNYSVSGTTNCFYACPIISTCAGTTVCISTLANYFCACATSFTANPVSCGQGGNPGFGIGPVVGVNNLSYTGWSYGMVWGGAGSPGGYACKKYLVNAITPGNTVSVCVGTGGSAGAGLPGTNTCEKVCCCCTPPGCASPGLYAFSFWPRFYTAGTAGNSGVVCICYYA